MNYAPTTFGKAPAAIYLVELLNQRADPRLSRKVSTVLTTQRRVIEELGRAHLTYDTISLRVFAALMERQSQHHHTLTRTTLGQQEPHLMHLIINVLEGAVKTWKRRIQVARRAQPHLARSTPEGCTIEEPLAQPLDNEKTPELLQQRSKRYLARKGKRDSLY